MAVRREDFRYHFILFLVTPVLGLIYGLKSGNPKYIRNTVFWFTFLYGSLFHISFLGDGASHWNNMTGHYMDMSFSEFWDGLLAILTLNPNSGTNTDPYIHVLEYLVGSVFRIPRFFFFVVSLVYAYFYSGTLVRLLRYVNWESKYNKVYFIFFLIIFLLQPSLPDIQYIRSSTGFWVLMYAVISYFQTKKKKYLFLLFIPVFIHVGYVVLAAPIWLVTLTGFRNPKAYFIVFMLSVLTSSTTTGSSFNEYASQTEVGARKVGGYATEGDVAEKREEKIKETNKTNRFYRQAQNYRIQNYIFAGMVIFIFLFVRNIGFDKLENTIFSYALATGSMANFLSFNFAIYNRGWVIAGFLILYLMLLFLSKNDLKNVRFSFLKVKFPLFFFMLGLIPYLLYYLSTLISFTSPYLLIFPIANWINYDIGTNLRSVIGIFL